jgi:hypothetical protein
VNSKDPPVWVGGTQIVLRVNYRITYMSSLYDSLLPRTERRSKPLGNLVRGKSFNRIFKIQNSLGKRIEAVPLGIWPRSLYYGKKKCGGQAKENPTVQRFQGTQHLPVWR